MMTEYLKHQLPGTKLLKENILVIVIQEYFRILSLKNLFLKKYRATGLQNKLPENGKKILENHFLMRPYINIYMKTGLK
jgi:hypothetical protein